MLTADRLDEATARLASQLNLKVIPLDRMIVEPLLITTEKRRAKAWALTRRGSKTSAKFEADLSYEASQIRRVKAHCEIQEQGSGVYGVRPTHRSVDNRFRREGAYDPSIWCAALREATKMPDRHFACLRWDGLTSKITEAMKDDLTEAVRSTRRFLHLPSGRKIEAAVPSLLWVRALAHAVEDARMSVFITLVEDPRLQQLGVEVCSLSGDALLFSVPAAMDDDMLQVVIRETMENEAFFDAEGTYDFVRGETWCG